MASGNVSSTTVEFDKAYTKPPTVLCSINGGAGYEIGTSLSCQTALVTNTGMSLYVYNSSGITVSKVGIYWIAIST